MESPTKEQLDAAVLTAEAKLHEAILHITEMLDHEWQNDNDLRPAVEKLNEAEIFLPEKGYDHLEYCIRMLTRNLDYEWEGILLTPIEKLNDAHFRWMIAKRRASIIE